MLNIKERIEKRIEIETVKYRLNTVRKIKYGSIYNTENYCRFAKVNGLETLNVGYIMRLNTIHFWLNAATIICLRANETNTQ